MHASEQRVLENKLCAQKISKAETYISCMKNSSIIKKKHIYVWNWSQIAMCFHPLLHTTLQLKIKIGQYYKLLSEHENHTE